MAYCPNCGAKTARKAAFCVKCGKPLKESGDYNRAGSFESQNTARNTRKCPSCGAEVPSLTAECPYCGQEFNSGYVAASVRDFADSLSEYDNRAASMGGWRTWGVAKKIGWVILNIYTLCIPLIVSSSKHKRGSARQVDSEKAAFVKNYVFPSEKEAIVEGLLFVKGQITALCDGAAGAHASYWEKIWMGKAQQLNEKARVLLQSDIAAQSLFNEIVALDTEFQKRRRRNKWILWGIIAVLFLIYFIPTVIR